MSTTSLTVAAGQTCPTHDVQANAAAVRSMMRQAHDAGCAAILFCEGCLSGYPDAEHLAQLDFDRLRTEEQSVIDLAGELHLATLVGSTSRDGEAVYNDVLIIDELGRTLGRYAKTWRAGEPWYAAGSGPVVFRVAGVEATCIICHDLRYPELVRLAVAAGAQLVFIANNEAGVTAEHKLVGYRAMQIARATENHVFSVMANAAADAGDVLRRNTSHGNSKIVDPMGNVLDEARSFEQRLVTATLNLAEANRGTPLRVLGEQTGVDAIYGTACEHPALAAWLRDGVRLVTRLTAPNDGSR